MGTNTSGTLSIAWPSGLVESYGTVNADQLLHLVEGGALDVNDSKEIANRYELKQNYPNPFNPSTTIRYSLQNETLVTVKVFNLLGQEIATLVDEVQTPGAKQVEWDGKNQSGAQVASGLYLYRMKAGKFVKTQKMILSK
jgi:hypothetical protein